MNAPRVLTFEGATYTQLRQSTATSGSHAPDATIDRAGSSTERDDVPWGPITRDRETGSIWSAATGIAIAGPLKDARLIQIPTTPSFWFAWADLHPETSVWGFE